MDKKECEICGRPIRTGRKYCYEHRNSGNSESDNKMVLLMEAEREFCHKKEDEYIKELKEKGNDPLLKILIFNWGFRLSVIICIFSAFYGLIMNRVGWMVLFLFFIFISIGFAAAKRIIKDGIYHEVKKRVDKLRDKRSEEYTTFIKRYIRKFQEEKEYKKSLFNNK